MYGRPISSTSATNLAQRLIDAASGPANDVARRELRRTTAITDQVMNSSSGPRVLQGHMAMSAHVNNLLIEAGSSPTSLDGNLTMVARLQNYLWASITKPGRIYAEAQRVTGVADYMAEGGGNRRTTVNNGQAMVENIRRSQSYTQPRKPPIRANTSFSRPSTLEGLQPTKSTYIQMNGTGYGYRVPVYASPSTFNEMADIQSAVPPHRARAQLQDATRRSFPIPPSRRSRLR